jgi:hypothetical protein
MRQASISTAIRDKPLQAGKLVGILLTLALGVGGFFRIIDPRILVDGHPLGDGQFLALIAVPLASLGLVLLVFTETLVSGYRVLRSEEAIADRITSRPGYMLLRGAEATVAVVGVAIICGALPPLFAESTPAPAGVGLILLLAVVGLGILVASFVRSTVELFVYGATD